MNLGTLAGVYRTPAIHAEVTAVFTNTNPMRPYRGNGRPEFGYVIERMVDEAAAELGIDPIELRRRNMIPPEAMPFKTGLTFTYDCGEFAKNLDLALELADFAGFEARRAEATRGRGKLRGIGLSNTIERAAAGGFEAAEIRFDQGGTVTLLSGSITQGMGHETDLQAADVRPARHPSRPGAVHPGRHRQGGDRRGHRRLALGDVGRLGGLCSRPRRSSPRRKAIAAHMLEASEADVEFADGVLADRRHRPRALRSAEIAARRLGPDEPARTAWSRASSPAPPTPPSSRISPTAVHICELEIDPETGTVEILRYSVVDDVGTVLNPLLLEGQIAGGIVQGVGQILMEDIRFDAESGQLVTGSFMDYAMPRAGDLSAIPLREQPGADQDQPLGRQGRGRSGRGRRDAGGRQRAGRRAEAARHPRSADAGEPGAAVAGDPRGGTVDPIAHGAILAQFFIAGRVCYGDGPRR